jgi:hypothetical protein
MLLNHIDLEIKNENEKVLKLDIFLTLNDYVNKAFVFVLDVSKYVDEEKLI